MNIGHAARETGLSAKTIRYYEDIGLVDPARSGNGYRDFNADQVHRLHLLAQARQLGFGLEECRQLLTLNADPGRASRDVRALALANLDTVRAKIRDLQDLETHLTSLIDRCHGDDDPACAILDELNAAHG
ncbi:Cu(I)-responsive transcriptional regulator [Pseudooceanicola sp. C21-150M6]|uniref:Cu(I)-responsive transcriptional regulator n=1 Tax=Pseudooceanicola sp. C21-150M6 TaxID=3434355 RepID=UPI003D7F32E7